MGDGDQTDSQPPHSCGYHSSDFLPVPRFLPTKHSSAAVWDLSVLTLFSRSILGAVGYLVPQCTQTGLSHSPTSSKDPPPTQGTTICRIACCLPSWSFEAHLSLSGFVTLSSALSVDCWLGLFKHCAVPLDLVFPKASSAVFLSSKSSVIFLVYPILLGWVGPGPIRPWDNIKGCGNTKTGDQNEDGFLK